MRQKYYAFAIIILLGCFATTLEARRRVVAPIELEKSSLSVVEVAKERPDPRTGEMVPFTNPETSLKHVYKWTYHQESARLFSISSHQGYLSSYRVSDDGKGLVLLNQVAHGKTGQRLEYKETKQGGRLLLWAGEGHSLMAFDPIKLSLLSTYDFPPGAGHNHSALPEDKSCPFLYFYVRGEGVRRLDLDTQEVSDAHPLDLGEGILRLSHASPTGDELSFHVESRSGLDQSHVHVLKVKDQGKEGFALTPRFTREWRFSSSRNHKVILCGSALYSKQGDRLETFQSEFRRLLPALPYGVSFDGARLSFFSLNRDRLVSRATCSFAEGVSGVSNAGLFYDAKRKRLLVLSGSSPLVFTKAELGLEESRLLLFSIPQSVDFMLDQENRIPVKSLAPDLELVADGLPDGLRLEDRSLVWTPTREHFDAHTLSLSVTHQGVTHKRIIRVNVERPSLTLPKNFSARIASADGRYLVFEKSEYGMFREHKSTISVLDLEQEKLIATKTIPFSVRFLEARGEWLFANHYGTHAVEIYSIRSLEHLHTIHTDGPPNALSFVSDQAFGIDATSVRFFSLPDFKPLRDLPLLKNLRALAPWGRAKLGSLLGNRMGERVSEGIVFAKDMKEIKAVLNPTGIASYATELAGDSGIRASGRRAKYPLQTINSLELDRWGVHFEGGKLKRVGGRTIRDIDFSAGGIVLPDRPIGVSVERASGARPAAWLVFRELISGRELLRQPIAANANRRSWPHNLGRVHLQVYQSTLLLVASQRALFFELPEIEESETPTPLSFMPSEGVTHVLPDAAEEMAVDLGLQGDKREGLYLSSTKLIDGVSIGKEGTLKINPAEARKAALERAVSFYSALPYDQRFLVGEVAIRKCWENAKSRYSEVFERLLGGKQDGLIVPLYIEISAENDAAAIARRPITIFIEVTKKAFMKAMREYRGENVEALKAKRVEALKRQEQAKKAFEEEIKGIDKAIKEAEEAERKKE